MKLIHRETRRRKPKGFPFSPKRLPTEKMERERRQLSADKARELNEQFHVLPTLKKVYGRKFGSKKVLRLFNEDGVVIVEYLDYEGRKNVEALVIFNRWAGRRMIELP